jgi:ankyrin repeat protein
VKLLITKKSIDVDYKNEDGWNLLLWAAGNGHLKVVKLLIDKEGIQVDLKDKDGRTPFWWAAGNGHSDIVELFLENEDVDIDSKDKCWYHRVILHAVEGIVTRCILLMDV